ncbi:MAG TPA: hypothetical protein VFW98_08405 [Gemmatimonadaceae bacterium]|nr:hypothetical protein [Gemmatimonadaceae bacterium]
MRTTHGVMLLLVCSLMACGGDSPTAPPPPPSAGPLALAIVSGQGQTVQAGVHRLGAPVVSQMVRTPEGRLVMRMVGSAQTVVSGSPVPGAVVCAVSTDSVHELVPFTPCTNTDSAGQATFFFTPPTTVGEASAEIRGTLGNQPAVFDTAQAMVTAGPAASLVLSAQAMVVFTGQMFDWRTLLDSAADAYGNPLQTDSARVNGDTLLASEGTGQVHYAMGNAGQDVAVTALADLSGTVWMASYRCRGTVSGGSDSVVVSVTTASWPAAQAHYAALEGDSTLGVPPIRDAHSAILSMELMGSKVSWRGSTADTSSINALMHIEQFPDSVRYIQGTGIGFRGTATLSGMAPRTYTGGLACPDGSTDMGAVELVEQ